MKLIEFSGKKGNLSKTKIELEQREKKISGTCAEA
jgi:hypothetical protein